MSMSAGRGPSDPLLVRYLLGALPDHETERLDELSIADDQVATRLRVTEHDLVDAYVRAELSGDTLDRFRARYLSTERGREMVAFAATLLAHQRATAESELPPVGERAPWFSIRLVPREALAAVALIAMTVAGYLFSDNMRLRREASDARAALARRASEPVTPTGTRAAEPSVAPSPSRPVAPVLSLVLMPARRGVAEVPTISIPRSGSVTIHLVLEFDDFPRYTIELKKAADGAVVWHSPVVAAASIREGRAVSATVPASVFERRRYVFDVAGQRARGAVELVGSYPVRVVLE
jgi:hypothetical protein